MITNPGEKEANLNEKHEREDYIIRLSRYYDHKIQQKVIKELVVEASGLNVPNNFYMVRTKSALYVPHGSVSRSELVEDDD